MYIGMYVVKHEISDLLLVLSHKQARALVIDFISQGILDQTNGDIIWMPMSLEPVRTTLIWAR